MKHCRATDARLVEALRPAAYEFEACKLPRIVDSFVAALDLVARFTSEPVDAVVLMRFDTRFRFRLGDPGFLVDWGKMNLAFPDGAAYWRKESKASAPLSGKACALRCRARWPPASEADPCLARSPA